MHILFLTDNFPPEVNAPASRTYDHCRQWVESGATVTVVTCVPNFPQGKVFAGYRNRPWQVEMMDGIRVIRVWSYVTSNDGFLRRSLDYISFMVTATIASIFIRRVDVVVGTSPQFFTVCAARVVGMLKRRPWIFELRDIWPESIKAVGAMRDTAALRALERLEMYLYRKANRIVAVTHAFKDLLANRGVDSRKIDVVTNGANLATFAPRERDADLARRLGLAGRFVAGYIGTHGMAHGLETLLDAAALLQSTGDADRVCLLFLGNGARKADLVGMATDRGLHNVLFLDSVPKDEVARYWALLDVSIIHLRKAELFKSVIPSKLFECMAMGVPVLHGVSGESADIVIKERVGEVFEPGNAGQLAQALVRLSNDPQACQAYGRAGVLAASQYDRKVLAGRMLAILQGLVSK